MITGFQATMEVDDGGTGGTGASTAFSGLVTFNLPALEAGKFDATELNQMTSGGSPVADPYERELPTGLIKVGTTKGEIKYTKANYLRLQALLMDRGKTFKLITPDDLTSGTVTKLTATFKGFLNKVDEIKFEKTNPVAIGFELTVSEAPTFS